MAWFWLMVQFFASILTLYWWIQHLLNLTWLLFCLNMKEGKEEIASKQNSELKFMKAIHFFIQFLTLTMIYFTKNNLLCFYTACHRKVTCTEHMSFLKFSRTVQFYSQFSAVILPVLQGRTLAGMSNSKSVVEVTSQVSCLAQSKYCNLFSSGQLAIHATFLVQKIFTQTHLHPWEISQSITRTEKNWPQTKSCREWFSTQVLCNLT